MRLSPGALAVVASDGVLADEEDDWLKPLLEQESGDMRALAKLVLREAEKRFGASDDMTVVTVHVEERA
jgi:serine/threonine protein phosphatase PrpC